MNKLEEIEEQIALNEKMQEKLQDAIDYLDTIWDTLIIEKARIERELECD